MNASPQQRPPPDSSAFFLPARVAQAVCTKCSNRKAQVAQAELQEHSCASVTMKFRVETPEGKECITYMTSEDTIADVKKRLSEQAGRALRNMSRNGVQLQDHWDRRLVSYRTDGLVDPESYCRQQTSRLAAAEAAAATDSAAIRARSRSRKRLLLSPLQQ